MSYFEEVKEKIEHLVAKGNSKNKEIENLRNKEECDFAARDALHSEINTLRDEYVRLVEELMALDRKKAIHAVKELKTQIEIFRKSRKQDLAESGTFHQGQIVNKLKYY